MGREAKLDRRRPVETLGRELAKVGNAGFRVHVPPSCSVINLRGPGDESLVTAAQVALGIELPLAPNRWHGGERLAAIWLGPDEWLVVAPDGQAASVEQALRDGRPHDPWLAVTDVSHNYTRLVAAGPETREILAKGCALDLRPGEFEPGHCAQTLLAKAPVLLRALQDDDVIELWFRNSYTRYLVAWLLDASASAS